jgi:Holliday junction DNA helicase RuvA
MIGQLKGEIAEIYDEYLILDVNGVGYRVFCTSKVLSSHKVGDKMSFIINTIVKDDAILLFGFTNNNEKKWFDCLCKINGIGNKMALNIMGNMTIDDIINAVDTSDAKRFSAISGIGKKIADRIIVELKNTRKKLDGDGKGVTSSIDDILSNDTRLKDTLSALENLGYQRNACYIVITSILKEKSDIVLESLITETLKRLNKF